MRISFPNANKAFTLAELLAIIVILFVLATIVLPASGRTKTRSLGIGCIANLRQLQNGWAMYKDDNNDTMMPNLVPGSSIAWCGPGVQDWFTSTGNTNV